MMKEAECTLGTEKVKARCWLPAQAGLRSLDSLFISPFPQWFALWTHSFGGGTPPRVALGGQMGLEGWENWHGECSLSPPMSVSSIASHRRGDGGTGLAAGADPALPGAGSPEAAHHPGAAALPKATAAL